ncbi:WD40 repeat domain-containing protein [Rhodopirellula bahusiensis]|uniref:WD40 repeat domain-containing protein n=1 Tax=Rhodopirellula bahusiensis TaxID=2014065 RepID=UPI003266AAD8
MIVRHTGHCVWIALLTCFAGHGGLIAQESDQSAKIRLKDGTVVMHHEDGPVGVHLTNNGRVVACEFAPVEHWGRSATAKAIVVVELSTGREISRMPYSDQFVAKRSACSPDGRYFVACGKQTAKLFDLETETLLRSWPLDNANSFVVGNPKGYSFALCDEQKTTIWNFKTGEPIAKLPQHPTMVMCASFDQQGTCLLTSCNELTRKWDLESKTATNVPVDHSLNDLAINPEGSTVFGTYWTNSSEGGVASFDMRLGRRLLFLPNHHAMQINFETGQLFTVRCLGDEGVSAVQLRRLANPDSVEYLPFAPRVRELLQSNRSIPFDDLSLSPDGNFLLVRLEYGRLNQIWKLDSDLKEHFLNTASGLKHT